MIDEERALEQVRECILAGFWDSGDIMERVMKALHGRINPRLVVNAIDAAKADFFACSDCGDQGFGSHACPGRPGEEP